MSSRAAGSSTRARRPPCGETRRSSHAISDCEGHEMKRIAIIGVGLLGGAVASRLLEGTFAVSGYDTRPDQLARLAPLGLTPATSVKDAAAGADAVFTILPSPESVEAVILRAGGPLGVMPRPATPLPISTVSPPPTPRPAHAAAGARPRFPHAPRG